MSDYWSRTNNMIKNGEVPNCPYCSSQMIPEDDHGRFICFCPDYQRTYGATIPPQVRVDVPDSVKRKIPPINRLYLPPTKEEQALFDRMLSVSLDDLLTGNF